MGTAVLWAVLLGVAVGLPLLALAADRAAARRTPPEDLYAFRLRHGLSADDAEAVERAMRTGLRAEQARLRPFVVERAQARLAQGQWPQDPVRRRWAVAGLLVATAVLVLVLTEERPSGGSAYVFLVNVPLQVGARVVQRRRLRRAVTANGDDTADGAQPHG